MEGSQKMKYFLAFAVLICLVPLIYLVWKYTDEMLKGH